MSIKESNLPRLGHFQTLINYTYAPYKLFKKNTIASTKLVCNKLLYPGLKFFGSGLKKCSVFSFQILSYTNKSLGSGLKKTAAFAYQELFDANEGLSYLEGNDGGISTTLHTALVTVLSFFAKGVYQSYIHSSANSKLAIGAISTIEGSVLIIMSGIPQKTSAFVKRKFFGTPQADPIESNYKIALTGICFLGAGLTMLYDGFTEASEASHLSPYELSISKQYGKEALEIDPLDPREKVLIFATDPKRDHNGVFSPHKSYPLFDEVDHHYDMYYQTIVQHPNEVCESLQEISNMGVSVKSVIIQGHGNYLLMALGEGSLCSQKNANLFTSDCTTFFKKGCFDSLQKGTPINLDSCSTGRSLSIGLGYGLSVENPDLKVIAPKENSYSGSFTTFDSNNGELQATNLQGLSITRVFENGKAT